MFLAAGSRGVALTALIGGPAPGYSSGQATTLPLAIIMAVPFGVFGALLADVLPLDVEPVAA